MAMFMSKNPPAQRTLADIIQEKLTEKQTEIQSQMSGIKFFFFSVLFAFFSSLFKKYLIVGCFKVDKISKISSSKSVFSSILRISNWHSGNYRDFENRL